MMLCTEPLPKLVMPRMVARLWSCSAPDTISDADAVPPLTSTTTGLPSAMSPGLASKRWVSSEWRPRVETISPAIEKIVGHLHRLVQQPARIVAQVDDIAADIGPDLFLEVAHRPFQARRGLFIEAGQGPLERLLLAGALDGQDHLGADRPAHLVDGFIKVMVGDLGAVDGG